MKDVTFSAASDTWNPDDSYIFYIDIDLIYLHLV